MSARPELPFALANPKIPPMLANGTIPPVKYQVLNSAGVDILVGRLKIETEGTASGHAFILRRFDTQALSLTTMYRAAFPTASPTQETEEAQWVKDHFDLSGNNGSKYDASIPRLAGTWVHPSDAMAIAAEYGIPDVVRVIVDAVPDPKSNYRRSKARTDTSSPAKPVVAPSPLASNNSMLIPSSLPPLSSIPSDSSLGAPAPAKRRKESSPVPSPAPAPSSGRAPRRSTRTKSPPTSRGPPSIATMAAIRKTPTRQIRDTRREDIGTPGGSDETAYDEENDAVVDTAAGSALHQQDVSEQKAMISRLKAEMSASDVTMGGAAEKRYREDEDGPMSMTFKDPETEQRMIKSNSRIRTVMPKLETEQKSFAWGVAAFAVGFGAMTYLPNFF